MPARAGKMSTTRLVRDVHYSGIVAAMTEKRGGKGLVRRDVLKAGLVFGAALVPGALPWAADAAGSMLLVRVDLVDVGSRPLPIGTTFWESPDIAESGGDPWGRVPPGANISVQLTAWNVGGALATGVGATFWWAPASVSIAPSTATLIGTSTSKISISPGGSGLLQSPTWRVGTGDECLVVQLASDQESAVYPFMPELDRRVGQRNVSVLASPETNWPMPLQAANPFPEQATTDLLVSSRFVRNAGRLLGKDLGISPADVLVHIDEPPAAAIARKLGLVVEQADPGTGVQLLSLTPGSQSASGFTAAELTLLRQRAGSEPPGWGRVLVSFVLPGQGTAIATLRVDRTAPADAAVVHEFRQVSERVLLGGYAMILPPAQ
jgi:hypothetical protein